MSKLYFYASLLLLLSFCSCASGEKQEESATTNQTKVSSAQNVDAQISTKEDEASAKEVESIAKELEQKTNEVSDEVDELLKDF